MQPHLQKESEIIKKYLFFEKVTNQNVTLANRKIPEFPWISTRICQGYRQVLSKHSFAKDFAIFCVNHSFEEFFSTSRFDPKPTGLC